MMPMGKVFESSLKRNFSEEGYLMETLVKVVGWSRARLQYIPTLVILTAEKTKLQISESESERRRRNGELTEGLPVKASPADRTGMRHRALAGSLKKTV